MRIVITFLALGLALCGRQAAAQTAPNGWQLTSSWERDWYLKVWGTSDGLPQGSVNEVIQRRNGTLWVATFGGLAAFDGRDFRILDLGSTPALPDNRVLTLIEDRVGDLWIGFQEAGLYRMHEDELEEVLGPEVGTVWEVQQADDGSIWAGADSGLVRIASDGAIRWLVEGPVHQQIGGLLSTPGRVWAVVPDGYVRFTSAGEVERHDTTSGPFNVLQGAPDGSVLGGGPDGVWRLTDDGPLQVSDSPAEGTLLHGPDGTLWNVGREIAVDIASGSTRALLRAPPRFMGRSGLVDREGAVWIGTLGGGLIQITPKAIRQYADAWPDEVNVLVADEADGVWVGGCAGLAHATRQSFTRHPTPDECPMQMAADGSGGVFMTTRLGLLHFTEGSFEDVPSPDSPADIWRSEGRLLAHFGDRVAAWTGETWTTVFDDLPQAISVPRTRPLTTATGELWVAGEEGVSRWNGQTLTTFGAAEGLAAGNVRSLVQGPAGDIWVGTYGGGLSRISGDRVRTYTSADGLDENVVIGIVFDENGAMWLSGNRALSHVPAAQIARIEDGSQAKIEPVVFDQIDGYVEGNGHGPARTSDGVLWFPSVQGVVSISPADLRLNDPPPTVVTGRILVDGTPLPTGSFSIPPRPQTVEIEFSAPRFIRPQNQRYRYRLGDSEWSSAGDGRTAVFTAPGPGHHVFEIEVSNVETASVTTTRLALDIEYALVQRLWFQLLAAAALLGVLAAAFRTYDRALRRRADVLRREIDARKAAEEENEAIGAKLQHALKLEALGRLTGGIAHDFNNLLAVVLGHVELAAQNVVDPVVRDDLDTAQTAAERGAELTRQLLSFARRADLNPTTVDLGQKVTAIERFLEPTLGSRVRLHVVVESELWPVTVDVPRLENVLLNLSQNARDAMPDGGNVTVRVENVVVGEVAPVEVSAGDTPDPGEYVLLSVRDTGSGIPLDTVSLVLDPFFSTKAPGKGTGLGLSMAYGFAKQSGGHLNIETDPSHGTTVRLYLPRVSDQPGDSGAEEELAAGRGELILVIEDDPGVRDVAIRNLEHLGYRTLHAGSAAQARYILSSGHTIDLVLSDVVLPGESGIQFRDELSRKRPNLPVVLMSGHGDPRGEKGIPAGLDIFPKPFTRADLSRRVATELARSRRRGVPPSGRPFR